MRGIWNFRKQLEVSLFTREWIEMIHIPTKFPTTIGSPSLRGSGLKCRYSLIQGVRRLRLPLYEGVD